MPLYLPELLCPAGDEDALRAAVDSGANAVYLGYKAFGARASAVNFDDEALERAVRYAHLHHVRVHVTVNTLIKPNELQGVHDALAAIEACGADAVIVQDLGVARMVKRDFPKLHLHASTQMAICNAEGAKFAKSLGFDRVVLARECTLEDIRRAVETGIEIETFAHGALCTAVSGRCLMSSMSGGRSGNRGRCAQPCRQCLSLNGQEGPLLSLRDLCTLDDLPALCEAGVASLKVEGRLKSAEYVATVASVYRRALDAIAKGNFRPYDKAEKEQLLQIYNRGGFTRGHAMGAEDADLVTPERVSHEGLPIGEIVSVRRDLATMRVERALNDCTDRMQTVLNAAATNLHESIDYSKEPLHIFYDTVHLFNENVRDFSSINYDLRGSIERMDLAVRDFGSALHKAERSVQPERRRPVEQRSGNDRGGKEQ